MASPTLDAFTRAFSRNELFRGPALVACLLSAIASLLLVALLIHLYLISDLLVTHGRIEIPASAVAELPADLQPAGAADGGLVSDGPIVRSDTGIFPSVWWSRGRYWHAPLEAAYNALPPLRSNSSALVTLLLSGAVLGIVRLLLLSRAATLASRAGIDVATRLRRAMHRQTLRLGPSDLVDTEAVQVHELFTTEIDRIRDGVTRWVQRLARHPFELLLLAVLALSIDWRTALLCLFPLTACWYLLQRERHRAAAARQLEEARTETTVRRLSESFRKTRLVRGYGMENFEHEQFQKHLDRFRESLTRARQSEVLSLWLGRGMVLLCGVLVLFLVGSKVIHTPGDLSLAAAVTLLLTFAVAYRPLNLLRRLIEDRRTASAAAERVYRYLDRIPEVGQAVGAKFLQPLSKQLQFESVRYSLPQGRRVLDGVDLRIPAGRSAAIVSLDPLEAHALAYLLPRFIEPQSGRVLFDGEDIAWVTLESLRAETVYVGGTDPFLTGSVFENISCGNNGYSLQDVTAAAKQAHAHNFVLKLQQGYETILGEHGEQLDAGQSFRLGLARAILRNPALLIIEEPSTPLDDDTKAVLDDTYNRLLPNHTVLFLPARLSTLRRVDQIVVLHKGRVEAIGKYQELVRTSALYRHWEYLRFNEFRSEAASPAANATKPAPTESR